MLDDPIMQRAGRTHGTRERERSELELTWSGRLPCASPTVAVDPHAHMSIGPEGDGVLPFLIRHEDRVIPALEPDELPGCIAEAVRRVLQGSLSERSAVHEKEERR